MFGEKLPGKFGVYRAIFGGYLLEVSLEEIPSIPIISAKATLRAINAPLPTEMVQKYGKESPEFTAMMPLELALEVAIPGYRRGLPIWSSVDAVVISLPGLG